MAETTETARHPDLPPPVTEVGVIGWLHQNLFSSPLNVALTLGSAYIIYVLLTPAVEWLFIDARWEGDTREGCTRAGACWPFIKVRFHQFIYGFYPIPERWRVDLAVVIGVAAAVPLFIERFRWKKWLAIFLLAPYPLVVALLLYGGIFGLTVVETPKWSGLMLTLIIAATSIVASLPIGIMLALGRRSKMPLVRYLCIGFIEFVRAVPLITVLFMGSVMLPLFLPEGVTFDKLVRTLIVISLFAGAYMAEVVRGGLQAIPSGQYEAAAALGLGYWKMMRLIVLPQALRIVIPGIVSLFIGLFKDTTLVLIIGLFDLLNMAKAAVTDPKWMGLAIEGYVVTAAIFWVFCFAMSRYSINLERKLETGRR